MAFISGYMQALLDIHHHNMGFARRILLEMVGLEIEQPPRRKRGRFRR